MKIISELLLNIILITFPILIYFIYNCYRELKCEKYNKILLNISLFTSLYLYLKYTPSTDISKILLFLNIPILLSYIKNTPKVAILLSIIVVYYTNYIYNYEIILITIKFICFYIIYILSKKTNKNNDKIILILSVIQGFFLSIEYFYYHQITSIINILELLIMMIIFYIIPYILLSLYNLTDNITNLYKTVSKIEQEKYLKNSLFKITHEVKNPIAVCKGYLEMLDVNNINKTKKYTNIIKQEINRSLDIMNDFMELSKIKINKDILDITLLLEDIKDCLKILILSKDIKFIYNIDEEERYIEGDYNRLKQVFINILKNSIEAINTNGKIEINIKEIKKYYIIEIIDNGIGIDKENLSKIKEMFYTTKTNGTGLGVALSNEIIKSHNGELTYSSILGKYTKVYIKLPKYMI